MTACFSASVTGAAGAGVSAEPPPETRKSTRSRGAGARGELEQAGRGALAALVRHGMAGLDDGDPCAWEAR